MKLLTWSGLASLFIISTSLSASSFSPNKEIVIPNLTYPLSKEFPKSSPFGWRTHPVHGTRKLHAGLDIATPTGTPVLSMSPGTVEVAGWLNGYGWTLVIRDLEGKYEYLYAHLDKMLVKKGQEVKQGNVIALSGASGVGTGPHLHVEARLVTGPNSSTPIDPTPSITLALANLGKPINNDVAAKPKVEKEVKETSLALNFNP